MRHFVTIPRQPRKESNTQAGNKDTWAMVKDMASGKWKGPYKILIWGPGYICVSTGKGNAWIPIRRIRRCKPMSETAETQEAETPESPEKDHAPPESADDSFNPAAQRGSSTHPNIADHSI
uniref:Int n=1 Tax=Notamacropus eugenii TaxID=9315 RepID=E6Y2W2_NOTEU|nr:Int [Notamacropus eugenii]